MNNRRSFFKSLIGSIVAPKVAEALPATSPHQMIGYKCSDFVPVVYAPYIPLFTTQHIQLDVETIYRLVRSKKVVNGELV